jgi:lipoic acid synthetase
MDDLSGIKLDILTIGQYLQPTKKHLPVKEFVHPDTFAFYKEQGLKKGFRYVESGPLVRSSYHAEKHLF